jgi:tetratricopeptide (TPR) repeat protein
VLSYTAGESFTESIRRTYLPVLSSGTRANELKAQFEPLRAVVEKLDEDDHLGARRALLTLPESQREQRFARMLELEVLSGIEDAADDYAAAAERFAMDYPGSPSLPLQMLEVYSIRGEHELALRAVDQIDALVGGDPFLDFLRAGALRGLGRGGEAVAGLKKAVDALPDIEELRWALVDAAVEESDFAAVAATLRTLRSKFEYQLGVDDLQEAERYRRFLESAEGRQLVEELGSKSSDGGGEESGE